MTKDYLKIAIRNLRTRPLRSWLTIFGIVIGTFLIIALLSLSEGIKTAVLKELKMMGKEVIMVFPGELTDLLTVIGGGLKLEDKDIKAIKKARGVKLVVPLDWKAVVVRTKKKKKLVLLYGYHRREAQRFFREDMGWSLTQGSWPRPGKKEVIVGSLVPKEIFPGLKPGNTLNIKGRKFEVKGVLKSLGNKQDDSMVGLDLEFFQEITGERKGARFVLVKKAQNFQTKKVEENIKKELEKTRKRKREGDLPPFSVLSSEKVAGIAGNIMAIIQIAIFAIASIAILVGGIGIMNTMYTAVRERTKEIGIMKAVGAKTSDIATIFLIESGIMGLVGGAGGSLFGFLGAKIVEIYFQFHPLLYLKAHISPLLFIFGLLFAFLIGCLAGYLPARRAANLKPVDALRYE